ncbi:MAG: hypothetical protein M1812_004299 [Candelaria pacifica]|nr:MAG: hypothetical protein M1812_004299 [Candelaria pacifica]
MAEIDQSNLINKVQNLSDLELATLLCLVANQHCIIETEDEALDQLGQELSLVASTNFGLSAAIVDCSANQSLDDFRRDILVLNNGWNGQSSNDGTSSAKESSFPRSRNASKRTESTSHSLPAMEEMEKQALAQVIIAKNLNLASLQVQIQALELIRTKRIFTHTAFHTASKRFVFIALLSADRSRPKLVSHLNDQIFVSHYHSSADGFPNLESEYDSTADDGASMSSVVRKPAEGPTKHIPKDPIFSDTDIETLTSQRTKTVISAEVKRYMQNITTFLRMHRAVGGGISAYTTRHFDLLVKCLAPLHSLNYATPSLVVLAARKIYPHRIAITKPENERSMQWGSDIRAVAALLEGITPEDIIDEVIAMVEAPL